MRPLDLNLATRPYSNNTLVWLAYIGLALAAIGFSYWNVSSFHHYRSELATLDREQGNMEQEQVDLASRHRKVLAEVKKFDRVAINRQTSKANEVIEWRAFSWTRLFNRLEEVLPNNIRMTSIRPIFRSRDRDAETDRTGPSMPVKVEGLAKDWDALFALETVLIDDVSFGRVLPRNIDKRDNGELAFSIEFTYYPEARVKIEEIEPAPEIAAEATAEPPVDKAEAAVEAEAKSAGERRKLPQTDGEPAEVTDEWAETARETEPPETTNRPGRRTLPRVEPADAAKKGDRR